MSNLIIENKVTMSSLEIVEFINNHRSKSIVDVIFPTLRHSDFMAKVPKVLGDEFSEKFRSTYLANNGKENPCYRFQKREACLMAMSYSYELQAIIFDRMTELENNYKKNVVQEIALPQDYLSALKALVESEEAKQIAEKYLNIVGLGKFINAYPSELSGGMQRRVSFARALSYRGEVFILDEPFKGLDFKLKTELINYLLESDIKEN